MRSFILSNPKHIEIKQTNIFNQKQIKIKFGFDKNKF